MRPSTRAALFLVLAATAAAKPSRAAGDGLAEQARTCDSNIAYFRSSVDRASFWNSVFMIAGALMSGTGAVFAAFLSTSNQRKAAALVGALGAVVTVLPKALPSKEALSEHLNAAERHRLLGTKVRNQFQFAEPDESLTTAKKYVSARFTDCASLEPPSAAPDLPTSGQQASHELTQIVDAARPFEPAQAAEPLDLAKQQQRATPSGSAKPGAAPSTRRSFGASPKPSRFSAEHVIY